MIDRVHGKPIDVATFKKPVLEDIRGHLEKIQSIVTYLADNEQAITQSSCYICGTSETAPLFSVHGFQYVSCQRCGHVYTSRRYTDDAIRRFYEKNEYWAKVTYANRDTCHYRRENVAKPKVEFAEQYLGDGRGGVWLDIGSGIGDLVSVTGERGWESVGLELSETSVAFAKEMFGVDLRRQTMSEYLEAEPDVAGTISVVSMIGVLEHTVDPMGILRDVHSALRNDGLVMIQVPNAKSLASMVQGVFPENVFRHMSPIEHIMLFTEQSLNYGLEQVGFTPVAYWYHGLDFYELLTNLVLANGRVAGSALYGTLLSTMNELQLVIDQRELSDRIICVARKRTGESA